MSLRPSLADIFGGALPDPVGTPRPSLGDIFGESIAEQERKRREEERRRAALMGSSSTAPDSINRATPTSGTAAEATHEAHAGKPLLPWLDPDNPLRRTGLPTSQIERETGPLPHGPAPSLANELASLADPVRFGTEHVPALAAAASRGLEPLVGWAQTLRDYTPNIPHLPEGAGEALMKASPVGILRSGLQAATAGGVLPRKPLAAMDEKLNEVRDQYLAGGGVGASGLPRAALELGSEFAGNLAPLIPAGLGEGVSATAGRLLGRAGMGEYGQAAIGRLASGALEGGAVGVGMTPDVEDPAQRAKAVGQFAGIGALMGGVGGLDAAEAVRMRQLRGGDLVPGVGASTAAGMQSPVEPPESPLANARILSPPEVEEAINAYSVSGRVGRSELGAAGSPFGSAGDAVRGLGEADGGALPAVATGVGESVPLPVGPAFRGEAASPEVAPETGGVSHLWGTHFAEDPRYAAKYAAFKYGDQGIVRSAELPIAKPFSTDRGYGYEELRSVDPEAALAAARQSGVTGPDQPISGQAMHDALVDQALGGQPPEDSAHLRQAIEAAGKKFQEAGYDSFHHVAHGPDGPTNAWAVFPPPLAPAIKAIKAADAADLHAAGYQIRRDFVTDRKAGTYHAGVLAEKLHDLIPDPQTQYDATALLQGTGNVRIPGDTHEAVKARVAAMPEGPKINEAVAEWRKRTNEMHNELTDIGGDIGMQLGFVNDWINQQWERKPEASIDVGAGRRAPGASGNPILKPRTFLNLEEGVKAGGIPKAMGLPEAVGRSERLYAQVHATWSMLRDLGELNGQMPDGAKAIVKGRAGHGPDGYVRMDSPILQRAAVGGGDTVYVHPDLADELRPVLTSAAPTKIDKVLATAKAANFTFSMFHGGSLTLGATRTMGLGKGLLEAGKRGFGLPGVAQIAKRLGGTRVAEDAALEAIRAGVSVDAPTIDSSADILQSALRSGSDWVSQAGPAGRVAAAGVRGLAKGLDWASRALWEELHAPLKVTAYHHVVNQMLRLRDGDAGAFGLAGRTLSKNEIGSLKAMSGDQVRQSAAEMVNRAFGGQNWELIKSPLLNDPRNLRVMRRALLSPDWQVSSIGMSLAAASPDPVKAAIGRRAWINAGKMFVIANSLNYALTGHVMMDNEPGKQMELDSGLKDSKGRRVYYNVFKEEREAPDLVLGRQHAGGTREMPVLGFLGRKMHPAWNAIASAALPSGKSLTDFPSPLEQAQETAHREGQTIGRGENLALRGQAAARMMSPFAFTQAQSAGDIATGAVPFSRSKGLGAHEAYPAIAEAYRDGDSQRVEAIKATLSSNGYDEKKIGDLDAAARRAVAESPLPVGKLIADYGTLGRFKGNTVAAPGFASKPVTDLSRIGVMAADAADDMAVASSNGQATRVQQIIKDHPEVLLNDQIQETRRALRDLVRRRDEAIKKLPPGQERSDLLAMYGQMATQIAGVRLHGWADALRGISYGSIGASALPPEQVATTP
jgi:hypothetical protein